MEPRKSLNPSRIIFASNENYRELIAGAITTLMMYDCGTARYGNDQRVRQIFRRFARDYPPEALAVVLVDFDHCNATNKETDRIPTFRLFRSGQQISSFALAYDKPERVAEWLEPAGRQ